MSRETLVIAIDGPAASGKGTLARRLAKHYGLRHLDTGLTYRAAAAAWGDWRGGGDPENVAAKLAEDVDFDDLDPIALSHHSLSEAASKIAVIPEVRRVLVEKQRDFAHRPPGAVLDGRDIGTVVLPEAPAKLYVTATPEARAHRRALELRERGTDIDEAEVLSDIRKRDARDMGRADSPLRPAPDAYLLDTTDKDIEAAFRAAVDYVSRAIASR